MLNDRGGYEADVTVTRETDNKYLIVSASQPQIDLVHAPYVLYGFIDLVPLNREMDSLFIDLMSHL